MDRRDKRAPHGATESRQTSGTSPVGAAPRDRYAAGGPPGRGTAARLTAPPTSVEHQLRSMYLDASALPVPQAHYDLVHGLGRWKEAGLEDWSGEGEV